MWKKNTVLPTSFNNHANYTVRKKKKPLSSTISKNTIYQNLIFFTTNWGKREAGISICRTVFLGLFTNHS